MNVLLWAFGTSVLAAPLFAMANKAHTAVVRRLRERYAAGPACTNGFDIHLDGFVIEVETTATLAAGIDRLRAAAGRRFLAVTNREAIEEALALTEATGIGVMDPWGEILRESAEGS